MEISLSSCGHICTDLAIPKAVEVDKKEELKNLLKWVKFSFYVTENREIFIYLKNKKYLILISQPIFQRRINVEITLIRR